MSKKLILSGVGLLLISIVLILLQLWFGIMSEEIFAKLLITLGILLGANVVLVLILNHLKEESELKKDDFIN